MHKDARGSDVRCLKSRALLMVVGLGIVFFVSGFVLTVTSLAHPETASADGGALQVSESGTQGTSLSLLFGLLLSLAGVVLATAGPAMFFINARNGSS